MLASVAPLSGTLSTEPTATRLAYSITRPATEVAIRAILSDHEYEVYAGIARHAADYDNGCGRVLGFLHLAAHRFVVVKLYPAAALADELHALAQLAVQGLQVRRPHLPERYYGYRTDGENANRQCASSID